MARHEPDPPITEPEIVHCLFSTGTEVEVTAHFARIARELTRQLQRGLAKGGH